VKRIHRLNLVSLL